MSLVTPAEVKELVRTSKTDAELQHVIDREEADVVRLYGAHYVAATTVTETLASGGMRNLYLRRRLGSITSVTEYQTLDSTGGTAIVATTGYYLWADQGRLERMPAGALWGAKVTIVYIPADDNDLRRAAIIDLVRLALERTAMQSEGVAGEYSYTAPPWEAARNQILERLGFTQA